MTRAVHPDGRVRLPGWDVWSGCYFLAGGAKNADLIEAIGEFLYAKLCVTGVLAQWLA